MPVSLLGSDSKNETMTSEDCSIFLTSFSAFLSMKYQFSHCDIYTICTSFQLPFIHLPTTIHSPPQRLPLIHPYTLPGLLLQTSTMLHYMKPLLPEFLFDIFCLEWIHELWDDVNLNHMQSLSMGSDWCICHYCNRQPKIFHIAHGDIWNSRTALPQVWWLAMTVKTRWRNNPLRMLVGTISSKWGDSLWIWMAFHWLRSRTEWKGGPRPSKRTHHSSVPACWYKVSNFLKLIVIVSPLDQL